MGDAKIIGNRSKPFRIRSASDLRPLLWRYSGSKLVRSVASALCAASPKKLALAVEKWHEGKLNLIDLE